MMTNPKRAQSTGAVGGQPLNAPETPLGGPLGGFPSGQLMDANGMMLGGSMAAQMGPNGQGPLTAPTYNPNPF